MLVFVEGWKPEKKKPSEKGQEPTTNSTHIWPRVWESNPGHIGGRHAHSSLPHLSSITANKNSRRLCLKKSPPLPKLKKCNKIYCWNRKLLCSNQLPTSTFIDTPAYHPACNSEGTANSHLADTPLLRTFAIADKIQIPCRRYLTGSDSCYFGVSLLRTLNNLLRGVRYNESWPYIPRAIQFLWFTGVAYFFQFCIIYFEHQ